MAGKREEIEMPSRNVNRALKGALGIANRIVVVNVSPKESMVFAELFLFLLR